MNDLLKMSFFSLLSENSQVTNQEMKNAYETFLKQVETLQSEADYSIVFRTLSFTRIESEALEPLLKYEQGEKCA